MRTAIILAGGLGTRLRSVVSDVPKPMAPVAGKPFLEHLMSYWRARGMDRFVLSVGYLKERIIDHFGDSFDGAEVEYSIEDVPLGTGGGLLLAMERMMPDAPFLLLNGDTFFDVDPEALLACHRRHGAGVTFSLFRAPEPDRFGGVKIDGIGRIIEFRAGKATQGQLANGGVYVIDPPTITARFRADGIARSFESDMLPALAADGVRLAGLECVGRFVDIGVPSDYTAASEILSIKSGTT